MHRTSVVKGLLICLGVLAMSRGATVQAATFNINASSNVPIYYPQSSTSSEQQSAYELRDYLWLTTGATCPVGAEPVDANNNSTVPNNSIVVGNTRYRQQQLPSLPLGDEQWNIREKNGRLVIAGGGTRGTLYGMYHFLEDVVGVRWWNPWENYIPTGKTLTLGGMNRTGKPAFDYRDVYQTYGNDGGAFAAHVRLNRDGDAPISKWYGGERTYGGPYHVHTFFLYLPPYSNTEQTAGYAVDHPDWYTAVPAGTKINATNAQLNLSNTAMRAEFLANLKARIASDYAEADAAGKPRPVVYSISQNDTISGFTSTADQALSQAQGSQAAPLLDFVNYLADDLKTSYPNVILDTLAYQFTEALPSTIRPRTNVVIRLTNTTGDSLKPISQQAFGTLITQWGSAYASLPNNVQSSSKIAMRIWDYHVNYSRANELPYPSTQQYKGDYQFYLTKNVKGIFTEFEYPTYSDMRDFKLWMKAKLQENPNAVYSTLETDFTDGFYGYTSAAGSTGSAGGAGADIRKYLKYVYDANAANPSNLGWLPATTDYKYLNTNFYVQANAILDVAASKVAFNSVLARRVRHARLSLDRAALMQMAQLRLKWINDGNPTSTFPLSVTTIADRYHQTRLEQADLRLTGDARTKEIADANLSYHMLLIRAGGIRPARFANVQTTSFYDFTADLASIWDTESAIVPDADAETGYAVKRTFAASNSFDPSYAYNFLPPIVGGYYDTKLHEYAAGTSIPQSTLAQGGYHWHRLGVYKLKNTSPYVYLYRDWTLQFQIGDAYNPAAPNQEYEVWVRVKAEGANITGNANDTRPDAFYVERAVVFAVPPRPAQFASTQTSAFFDFTADRAMLWDNESSIVQDSQAESGIAVKRTFTDPTSFDPNNLYNFNPPLPTGYYDVQLGQTLAGAYIPQQTLAQGTYQWHKLGTYTLQTSTPYIYLYRGWTLQFPIGEAYNADKPNQQYDVWVRVRAEGPQLTGNFADTRPNAFFVERAAVLAVP